MAPRSATSLVAALAALFLAMSPCPAGVVFYDNLAAFQANSTTSVAVTFEGFAPADVPVFAPISLGGVTFTPISSTPRPPNLFVRTPGGGQGVFAVPPSSNVLSSRGNEHFALDFSTAPFAVGFDTYTNTFAAPTVSVFDTAGNLLAAQALAQAPGTLASRSLARSRCCWEWRSRRRLCCDAGEATDRNGRNKVETSFSREMSVDHLADHPRRA